MAWALSDAECHTEPTGQVGMGHRTLPSEPRWHHLFPSLCLGTNVLQMFASRSQWLGNVGWRQEQGESSLPTAPPHLIVVIVQVICQKESKMGFTQALLCSLSSACPTSRAAPQHPWIQEAHPVVLSPCPGMGRLSPAAHPCSSSPGASRPTWPPGAIWSLKGPGASQWCPTGPGAPLTPEHPRHSGDPRHRGILIEAPRTRSIPPRPGASLMPEHP